MANSDKNIVITPNRNLSGQPEIAFTGFGNVPITLKVLDDTTGTLSFEGSAGQLFSITNNLTSGSIFSVNDVSGIPSLDVNADGTVSIAAFGGNVGIGKTNPATKLDVTGTVTATAFAGPLTGNATTATTLATGRTIGMTGDVTWTSASFDGSGNVTGTATLANSGVGAGTYRSVTVDAKGRVTAGTNPTTLSGYGITDAAASTHVHGNITNAGAIGSTANLPLITTTSGVITTGTFGTAANTFCQGNDSRLSNARTPTAHTHAISEITNLQTTLDGKASSSHTHAAGDITSGTFDAARIPNLDAAKITSGTISADRLPSYVDDVLEYANQAGFPATGETGKIYVALDTNKTYRWSGSAYVQITSGAVDSVAGKTGVVTLVKGDVGLGNVDNTADANKNVLTATKWATARTLSFTGDATGSGSVDGSQNVATALTLANSGATAGTYRSVTVNAKGLVTAGTNPTTLSGYGITDALSNATNSTQAGYFGDIYLYDDSTPSHYLQITNSANLTAARVFNLNVNDANRTLSLSGDLTVSSAATVSGTNTGDQTITLTGDVTGSGTGSFATTLANSGVTAGSYTAATVTVDAKGRITAASANTIPAAANNGTLTLAVSGTGLSGSQTFTANQSTNATFTVTSNATNANTASTIVARDASGNFSAGTITAALSGNASTATTLATGRTIGMTGDVTWTSASFNGSGNVTGTATLANSGATAGTYRSVTVDAKGRVTAGTNPTTLAGYGITDAASSSHTHAASAVTSGTFDLARIPFTSIHNNSGQIHATRSAFDASTASYDYGWRYVQGATNGPGTGGTQFYSLYVGLGSDYPATGAGSYGMYLAIDRNSTTPYLAVRYNENNSLSTWRRINAGYADSAGSVAWTNVTGRPTVSGTNTGDQTITLTGDVTGSGTGSFAATLANSGVGAGTYRSVTVDAKGRVTAGTNPTTLSGYGITDALSTSSSSTQAGYFGDIYLRDDLTPSHYLQITNSANLTAARSLSINVNDANRIISLSGDLTVSGAATVSGTNTGNQTITLTGDVTGSGTGSFAATLANSGVTAGTYRSVTVDAKGRVTAGTNPTTLSGYGITDAASSTHTHGNITNAGAIGSTSGLPIITTTSGVLTAGSFGTTSGTFCQGNDSRLSDARTPTAHTHAISEVNNLQIALDEKAANSHTHGNISSVGTIGSTANLPLITTTSGTITTGTFGTAANTFCQGNDARLSDTRTPTDNTVSTAKIQDNAVTFAKMQQVAAGKLLGVNGVTVGSGNVEAINLSSNLALTGLAADTLDLASSITTDVITSRSGFRVGSDTISAKTAAYTLAASDNGKVITVNSASAVNITIGTAVGSAGFSCTVIQLGAGQVTFVASSTTLNSANGLKISAQHGAATIFCYATNTFNIAGNTTT